MYTNEKFNSIKFRSVQIRSVQICLVQLSSVLIYKIPKSVWGLLSLRDLRRTLVGGETGLADTAGGETGLVDTAGEEKGLVDTGDSADASGMIETGATGEGRAADSGVPFCVLAA